MPVNKSPTVESRQELVEYLASGCKPAEQWKLGTEHEKFGYTLDDLRPLPYEGERGIRAVLTALAEQFGWNPVLEDGRIIALSDETGASITLEPGGQLELSGAILDNIHQTCTEVYTHLKQVQAVAEPLGAAFLLVLGIVVDDAIVVGEAILGANVFRDLFASITDIVGGRSGSYEQELGRARTIALREPEERAVAVGGNAVVGVDLDYEVINNMLMVSASGTAVVLA